MTFITTIIATMLISSTPMKGEMIKPSEVAIPKEEVMKTTERKRR